MSDAIPLDVLLEESTVGVAIVAHSGDVVRANAAFHAMAGPDASSLRALLAAPRFDELLAGARSEPSWTQAFRGHLTFASDSSPRRGAVYSRGDQLLILIEVDSAESSRLAAALSRANDALADLERDRARRIVDLEIIERELRKSIAEVRTLRGLLPICAKCKKIRTDRGTWQHLETYIEAHSEAEFTHGICAECMANELATLGPDGTGA